MATRTWVSGVGDDINPGSRTAPCKTFPGALSKTSDGGEISVLDPGGFGAVTITKSLTIDGTGGFASILASSTTGIIINGAGINVTIRGISINGAAGGLIGIRIIAANRVSIENCVIFGFTGGSANGVKDERAAGGRLFIINSTIRNNGQSGVLVAPSSGSPIIQAILDNVQLLGNGNAGLAATNGSRVTISDSVAFGNTNSGLFASSAVGTAELNIEGCVSAGNGVGITSDPGATVRISNVHVTNNGAGLTGAGTYVTYGNNRIAGNVAGNSVPGSPAPVGPQ